MKKFFKIISTIIFVIFLICLMRKLGVLDFVVSNISQETIASYSNYYFNKLDKDEKEIYIRIDQAINAREQKVRIGIHESTGITEKVSKVLTAYFYDNPEYYYISNEYMLSTKDIKLFKYSTITLEYLTNKESEITEKNLQLKSAIDKILNECIKEGMTDFEKELAIHDALVERVSYYEYENIADIPAIKHTAYAALVEKEAVCDGYAKAFKLLLEEAGIENVIVNGTADNVAHAWNIVKIGNNYYHVDTTSNEITNGDDEYVVHKYFNVTDEMISKTHILNKTFEHPKCTDDSYDYYMQKGYHIAYEDVVSDKLRDIIPKQKNSGVLEIKLDNRYHIQNIIDELYDLNFNNWRATGKTSASYSKMEDVYVILK